MIRSAAARAALAVLLTAGAATIPPFALAQQPRPAAPEPAAPAPVRFTPSHVEAAKELVILSGLARTFDGVSVDLAVQVMQSLGSSRPELAKDLQETIVALSDEINRQKLDILDLTARLFAEKLTEAETKEVVAFLKSPTGRKYVETQPAILPDFETLTRDWSRTMSEKIIIRVREEMRKKGHAL